MAFCIAITGCGGFVAPFLARHLRLVRPDVTIIGTALEDDVASTDFDLIVRLDVADDRAVKQFFAEHAPAEVYHLAGLSRPGFGAGGEFYMVNTLGALHIVSAAVASDCAVLIVSSGYIYGNGTSPFTESDPARPLSHYGASKYAGELSALVAARAGGRMVIARPFNHAGPGQTADFLLGSLVRQIVRMERDRSGGAINVGNRTTVRDYSDVRDVVRAYQILLQKGENGAVYNVASGRGVTVNQVLDVVTRLSRASVSIADDCNRQRPADLACLIGDPSRVLSLGWKPEIFFEETVAAMLDHERGLTVDPSGP